MIRILRLLLAVGLLGLWVIMATAAPAAAHANLVDSIPRGGSRVEQAPSQVVLRFDEPVRVLADDIRVLNAAGDRVDSSEVHTADNGRRVIIALQPLDQTPNSYLVSWRAMSADAHPISGTFRFGVRQQPIAADDVGLDGSNTDRTAAVISDVSRTVGYAGLVLAVGGVAVGLAVWPSILRSRRLLVMIISGTAAVLIGGAGELIINRLEAAPGAPLLLGRILLVLGLLSLSLKIAELVRARLRWVWIAVASGLLIITGAQGHALASDQPWLTITATGLHMAGMCCWIGGLLLLILIVLPRLRRRPAVLARAVAPWSRFAFGCLAALIISGELLAWRQVQPIEALWSTRYGVILLIKLGLVAIAVLLGLATARLVRRAGSVARISALLGAEIAAGVMIIIAATVLSSSSPAVNDYGPPVTKIADYRKGRMTVEIASTRSGPQQITVTSEPGQPLQAEQLTGSLSSTEAGVNELPVTFARSGDHWRSTDATAPLPGLWTLQLTIRPATGPAYVTSIDYRVW